MTYIGINKQWLEEHDTAIRAEAKAEGAKEERERREILLMSLLHSLEAEAFLCVDQDDPVVLLPDIQRTINFLRGEVRKP